ncbi:MAG: magnesium and cobalt transport protein CorA [Acidimicrobiia bacterium]|nr:magnesium and cobalt transport protein CorA [Acidimicrobiia bacterium]
MIVDCALYENGVRQGGRLALEDVADACRIPDAFVWIGLYEPSEDEFDSVRHEFGLHELAVEDAVKAHQRPKLEIYGDTLFLVLKTTRYAEEKELVELGEIMIFAGAHFVVHVRHGEATALSSVRREIESRPDRLRRGPAAVVHAITDRVVDDYMPVVEALDNDVSEVEFEVFSESHGNPVERIYRLKREVLELHSAVAPLTEPLERLARQPLPFVSGPAVAYFRDVEDHLLRIAGRVDTSRDLLNSILEANLTRVSVRQNEDMRKISAWVAIAAVPTVVTGFFGMNFSHILWLDHPWAWVVVLGLMATVCFFIWRGFRSSGWL